MSKLGLIVEREYLSRVKKKSFLIMSILGPVLIGALYSIPILLALMDSTAPRTIAVIDPTGELRTALRDTPQASFLFLDNTTPDSAKAQLQNEAYYALLYRQANDPYSEQGLVLVSTQQPSIELRQALQQALEKNIQQRKMASLQLTQQLLDSLRTEVRIETRVINEHGQEEDSFTELAMVLGFAAAFFIYFIIFLYGTQVMRGVIEEKSNRIVEIIISSVRPFELMLGKILGVALVVLTQLALWIVLSAGILSLASQLLPDAGAQASQQLLQQQAATGVPQLEPEGAARYLNQLFQMNLPMLLLGFIFYLVAGYLSYASLFAAVGAMVDNETDTQQFMLPVSVPLIIAFLAAMNVVREPDGPLAFWMSIVPLTSPISMMVRLPFGVPFWELALSMLLLVLFFLGTTWLAAKIYRTGILMYGKKTSYRELWRWLRHRA